MSDILPPTPQPCLGQLPPRNCYLGQITMSR